MLLESDKRKESLCSITSSFPSAEGKPKTVKILSGAWNNRWISFVRIVYFCVALSNRNNRDSLGSASFMLWIRFFKEYIPNGITTYNISFDSDS